MPFDVTGATARSHARGRRRSAWRAAVVVLLAVAPGAAYAASEAPSAATGAGTKGSVAGPPAPAVPDIAATPAPAAEPAVPNAPREPGVAARAEPEPPPRVTAPRHIDLWPWFSYEADPATQTRRVRILGPLLEYKTTPERTLIAFRPLISIDQARVGHDDEVHVLYPLLTSRWKSEQQETTGLGGVVRYRTRTSADGRTLEAQHMRLLPVYFYDWERPASRGRLSLVPIYADLEDQFGYEELELIVFPAYLRLKTPDRERRYYLFVPVTSSERTDGGLSRDGAAAIDDLHRVADDGETM
jgi:hypothetical protein